MTHRWPPVMGIWGHSGSGKTYLINHLIRGPLARQGLRVAVVKRCSHHMSVDTQGKDSDILFRAGADIYAHNLEEAFFRIRPDDSSFQSCLDCLGKGYDLVLVEGHRDSTLPKIWLSSKNGTDSAVDVKNIVATLPWESDRVAASSNIICKFLQEFHAAIPTYSAVLIGGRSRRMGSPKSMLKTQKGYLLDRIVTTADLVSREVLLVGNSSIPPSLANRKRLPDVLDVSGPLSGLLSAFRWHQSARWIVMACDMPFVQETALRWLLERGHPGTWVVAPRLESKDKCEPMMAVYEPAASVLLENAAARGGSSLRTILKGAKIASPVVPSGLRDAWVNMNTPEEWDAAMGKHNVSKGRPSS